MLRKVALLLLAVVLLAGCGTPPQNVDTEIFEISDTTEDNSAFQVVSLADTDLVIVPGENYYLLLEESLGEENSVFTRRYVKYDGFKNTVSDQVSEVKLPRGFRVMKDAKEHLAATAPEKLSLWPKTYVSANVLSNWEQEQYDYSFEEKNRISLDELKRLGAVARTSEVFVLNAPPQELAEKIKAVEEELLKYHPNLEIQREVEALPRSLVYRLDLTLHEKPLLERSPAVTNASLFLNYTVDELGHPLELTFRAVFETRDRKISLLLQPVINDLAVFTLTMREVLVENLSLYGVNHNNPSLRYANVTLSFEGEEDGQNGARYTEHYSIK